VLSLDCLQPVRQHLRFAKCVYEGGSASARGACKRAGKCLGTTGGDENEKKLLTNYHDGKLDTFLDLVALRLPANDILEKSKC